MKNLLIIGFVWPEPNSTAAGSRMMQLISIFLNKEYNIIFACTATKTPYSFNLESINIKTIQIELNNSSFNSFIETIKPDIVLFDRYLTEEQFGWRVSENCPNALKVLDTEDLHFLRNARQTALKKKCEVSLDLLMTEMAKREIASIYRCDITLIISKYEYQLLRKTFKIDKSLLLYTPFLLDKIDKQQIFKLPSFENRSHFMTMGNFRHEPNWNSVQYLKSTIWPLIRKIIPNAEIHIYGGYVTEKVQQLNNKKEGFIIKGWAENKEQTFSNYRICLAPLLFGAGLKGKLIDSMLFGTPNITTTIGAEGMHDDLVWNGFICDNPEEFAVKAVELSQDKLIWEQAQLYGIEIINNCFSKVKYGVKFIEKIEGTLNKLEKHRLKNFTGAMLQHHTLRSTKYLSKWIEEKNK